MAEDDLVTRLHQELTSANLRYHGIRREGNSVHLVYEDSRIDDRTLGPIKDKYHPQFHISTSCGYVIDELKRLGFSPETIELQKWKELLIECDIVTFALRGPNNS